MVCETEEPRDVETVYFHENKSCRERFITHTDSISEEMHPLTVRSQLLVQASNAACTDAGIITRQPKFLLIFYVESALAITFPVDSPSQWYIRTKMWPQILSLFHYCLWARHFGDWKINGTIRKHFHAVMMFIMQWSAVDRALKVFEQKNAKEAMLVPRG